ncbi:MAG TPA: helix-turn-helix domain-containing protein [Opitutaceae bacterium]|nr:helix-turn-helix domain-containing protein [Opitutaceae bacterium]
MNPQNGTSVNGRSESTSPPPSDLKSRPPDGWIVATRKALKLTRAGLARQLGRSESGLRDLEESELTRTISLAKLRELAHALDCDLAYGFIPRGANGAPPVESPKLNVERAPALEASTPAPQVKSPPPPKNLILESSLLNPESDGPSPAPTLTPRPPTAALPKLRVDDLRDLQAKSAPAPSVESLKSNVESTPSLTGPSPTPNSNHESSFLNLELTAAPKPAPRPPSFLFNIAQTIADLLTGDHQNWGK